MNVIGNSRIARIGTATIAALTLATGTAVLAGCGDSSSQTTSDASSTGAAAPSDGTAYTKDNTNITANVGDTFVIELPMNPSTGYQWQMTPKGDITSSLTSSDLVKDTPTSTGTETAVGVGGHENWTFTANTAGTGTLVFGSIPPGKSTAEETVTFNVTVTG